MRRNVMSPSQEWTAPFPCKSKSPMLTYITLVTVPHKNIVMSPVVSSPNMLGFKRSQRHVSAGT